MTRPTPRRPSLLAIAVCLLSAVAIGLTRPKVAAWHHELRVTSDVYPFPSPDAVVVASLGWRSALADAIFAHVLVSNGIHFQEKRRFEFVGDYLDTVNALDPAFRDPYRYADSLLAFSPETPRLEDYLKTREVLRRGVQNRPFDTELWLVLGQFLAYLARPHLPNEEMKREWKLEGARALSRACELAGKNDNVPYHCITAASLFESTGEREAAIESLRRILAVNDDPAIVDLALGYLGKKLGERDKEEQDRRRQAFRDRWKADLPFLSKDALLTLSPGIDPARCAGADRAEEPECAPTWREWARHLARAKTE